MSREINNNTIIQAGLRRLKQMGLVGDIAIPNKNSLIIIISGESMINRIAKIVKKNFNWNKIFICYDKEKDAMIVYIWQTVKPKAIEELKEKCGDKVW